MRRRFILAPVLFLLTFQIAAQCPINTAPYFETFEGSSWNNAPSLKPQAAGIFDSCWSRSTIDGFFFKVGPSPASNYTGAHKDHTPGHANRNYLYAQPVPGNSRNDTAELLSPLIDVSALNRPWLSFWYHLYGNQINKLEVQVSADQGQSYQQILVLNGPQQTSDKANWRKIRTDLSSFSNDTIRLKFRTFCRPGETLVSACIDDIAVTNKPNCVDPLNFRVLNLENNQATFAWDTSYATNWEIDFGNVGHTPGSGTIKSAEHSPFVLKPLNANRRYDVYLRSSCDSLNSSWMGPVRIHTKCNPVFLAPFSEDFNGSNFGPSGSNSLRGKIGGCWRRGYQFHNFLWSGSKQQPFAVLDDHTGGGKYVYGETFSSGPFQDSSYLETPYIITTPIDTPQLSFWYHLTKNGVNALHVYARRRRESYQSIQTITGPQQVNRDSSWLQSTIDLPRWANDTIMLRFEALAGNADDALMALDDVEIRSAPSCPQPYNFNADEISSNSVKLSWKNGGGSGSQVEYAAGSFNPGGGTRFTLNATDTTLSSLLADTTYYFYLRDSCNASNQSHWQGPLVVKTLCTPKTAPWTEDFEGTEFSSLTWLYSGPAGSINSCYSRNIQSHYTFLCSDDQNDTKDHTPGTNTTNYMKSGLQRANQAMISSRVAEFTTPLIDLSQLQHPQIRFWYKTRGPEFDSLQVLAGQPGNWAQIYSVIRKKPTTWALPWQEAIADLKKFQNDTIFVRFLSYHGSGSNFPFAEAAIDDLEIREKPSCPKPSNLRLPEKSFTTARINWDTAEAKNWLIEFGPGGFTPGTGTLLPVAKKPYTLSALQPGTIYDVYLKDSCGPGDVSRKIGPLTFRTNCLPQSAPWSENFEGQDFTPVKYTTHKGTFAPCFYRDTVAENMWVADTSTGLGNSGTAVDHTLGNGKGRFLVNTQLYNKLEYKNQVKFSTPLIDLSPLDTPQFSFWYHINSGSYDSLVVNISNGNALEQIYSISGRKQQRARDPWKKALVDIKNYAEDTVRLQFVFHVLNRTQEQTAIDDLSIHEKPVCAEPGNLAVLSKTPTSIDLNWQTGGAQNWQIEYGPAGYQQGQGTLVNATSKPFTVSGLNQGTIYDFYVRDSCVSNSLSLWHGPVRVATECSIYTPPLKENFDDYPFVKGEVRRDTGRIAPCWKRVMTKDAFWMVSDGNGNSNTGPYQDHTTGNGNFMETTERGTFNIKDTTTHFSTPWMDFSNTANPQILFWYHMHSAALTMKLNLEVVTKNGTQRVWQKIGNQQNLSSSPWKKAAVSIPSIGGDTARLRFVGKTQRSYAWPAIAIDDIWIRETPTCPAPSGIQLTQKNPTTLTVDWNTGGANNWIIAFREKNFGNFKYRPVTSKPFLLGGLNRRTQYEIKVRDSCSGSDVSFWTPIFTTTTGCGVVNAPMSETFDDTLWNTQSRELHPCWNRNPRTDSSYRWIPNSGQTTSYLTGPNSGANGQGQYVYTESKFNKGRAVLKSPRIFIPSSMRDPHLYFKYHMYGQTIDSLLVELESGTQLWSLKGQQQFSRKAKWKLDSISLSSYKGDTVQFQFTGRGKNTFFSDIALDDVELREPANSCEAPDSLSILSIATQTVVLRYHPANSTPTHVEYYPNLPGGKAVKRTLQNVSNPFTLNNLQPGLPYLIKIHNKCSANFTSQTLYDTIQSLPCTFIAAVAQFNSSQRYLTVNFNGNPSTRADSIVWDFGDGSNRQYARTPSHQYSSAGSYNVEMVAINNCGPNDTTSKSIQVCDSIRLNSFTLNNSGDTIWVKPNNIDPDYNYHWNFGDGTTSSDTAAKHTYSAKGVYTIILSVINKCGDTAQYQKSFINCGAPLARWNYQVVNSPSGFKVAFDGTQSRNAHTYQWWFGDGGQDTGATPVHTYSTPGLFHEVKLKVTNRCGQSDSLESKLINISLKEQTFSDKVEIFPVPTSSDLIVEWPGKILKIRDISIVDLRGRTVFQKTISSNGKVSLNLTDLADGVYVIRLFTNRGTLQKRIEKLD